jgi:hypothetical protein
MTVGRWQAERQRLVLDAKINSILRAADERAAEARKGAVEAREKAVAAQEEIELFKREMAAWEERGGRDPAAFAEVVADELRQFIKNEEAQEALGVDNGEKDPVIFAEMLFVPEFFYIFYKMRKSRQH